MPLVVVLNALHALSHNGVGDDDRRPTLLLVSQVQRHLDLAHIVPVNLNSVPSKGRPFVPQRINGHHFLRAVIDLQTVAVDDGTKVVCFMMRRSHSRFPHASLLLLAVAFGGIFCLRYRIFQECVAPWLGLAALLYGILYLLFRPRK